MLGGLTACGGNDTEKGNAQLSGTVTLNGSTSMEKLAKYFERIGDHATNLAEWVIFSIDKRPRG